MLPQSEIDRAQLIAKYGARVYQLTLSNIKGQHFIPHMMTYGKGQRSTGWMLGHQNGISDAETSGHKRAIYQTDHATWIVTENLA